MFGDFVVDGVFVMAGDFGRPFKFLCSYHAIPIRIPDTLRAHYPALASRVENEARNKGQVYFNGPNTRLLRITHAEARQEPTGEENTGYVLELGPVSWEEYLVLHSFLDDDSIFPHHGDDANTVRKQFANVETLYNRSPDLLWCHLSNILSVGYVPITLDGYGLVVDRSLTASSEPGKFGTFGENIHRYWDEAPHDDLGFRIHSLNKKSANEQPIDHKYVPLGVPSPLLAVQRGVGEELSETLQAHILKTKDSCVFLAVLFGLDQFRPGLFGIIDLGLTLCDVQTIVTEKRGKDHWEYRRIVPLPLDLAERETRRRVQNSANWIDYGLGGFVLAIKYWASTRGRFQKRPNYLSIRPR